MCIETLDTVYEDKFFESLTNLDVILYNVENIQRIVLCKMYLKYLTGGCDARKNCKIF